MTDESNPSEDTIDPDDISGEEPIDVEFREAPEPTKVKRGPGWISTFLMMLLAAGGGGALGYAGAERVPGLLGGGDNASEQADFATTNALEGVERAQAEAAEETAESLTALRQRLARAEGALEALQSAVDDDTSERLAALTARLDAIETLPTGSGEPGAENAITRSLASALARVDRLESRLEDSETSTTEGLDALRADLVRIAEDVAAARSARASDSNTIAEAALALSTIDAAARRGQDFAAAYSVLRRARPNSPTVAELAPIAETGAPTIEMLKASFEDVAEAVADTLEGDSGGGALGAAGRLFGDVVEVRSPEAAADYAALDEARAALEREDLAGAISSLSRLEGEAGAAAASWIRQAGARRALERALDTLRLDLMVEGQNTTGAP
ncbi:MAG: hypothetical protein AAFY10_10405 [Pseudomonadota bacterium]